MSASQPAKSGLSSVQARARLEAEGYNEMPMPDERGFWRILKEVLRQPMFFLLLSGGVVYLLLGDRVEALFLLTFATLSVLITLVQESRSERVLQALRDLASPRARVIRDGKPVVVPGREVVRGDLLLVAEGDRVAADAVLQSAHDLLLDESLLTGESVPVRKTSAALPEVPASASTTHRAPGGDDSPCLFAGSLVVRGHGLATITATGPGSEMGKLGRVLQTISTEQPALQKQLNVLVRNFALAGALAGILIIAMLVVVRDSWLEAMLGGIAVGMSLLPEEFPLVMSVFMAMGAWRISRARVLTRRAAAIETLGATTVLCTDKTGTLTENRMKVSHLVNGPCHWTPEDSEPLPDSVRWTLKAAWFACQDTPTDPMDRAIHQLLKAQRGRTSPANAMPALLKSFGLRPGLLAVTQVRAGEGGCRAYSKGAVEAIVGLCGLPVEQAEAIHLQARELAGRGVRVLGVAQTAVLEPSRLDDPGMTPQDLPFEFAGLVGFADPIRAKVPAAVAECRSAGIRVIMITGDYPETAAAIALQAGIQATQVVTGAELESMPDKQLAECVRNTSVFARIQPSQKLRIVQSLKDSGEIVAMTGDGVNDAAAIKSAHIGIAMGGRGTDVAREASSIVLLDDNFESIVATIRLGRRIYDNLRKAIEFIIAVHIPIAGLALLPLLMGLPLILTPILIAFLEMIIDPACSIVLEAEQEEDDVMQRPPRQPDSSLLQPQRIGWAIFQGSVALAILLAILLFTADAGFAEDDIRALTFVSLVLINMGLILVNRSFKSSLVNAFLKPNYALGILFSLVLVLLGLVVYWEPAQQLFQFGQLHLHDLGICIAVGISSLVLLELGKATWFRSVKPNGG